VLLDGILALLSEIRETELLGGAEERIALSNN
jgi:hypothetical protein